MKHPPTDQAWTSPKLAKDFMEGVRGAIPMAAEQIDILGRIAQAWRPDAKRILDLGCGDGILGRALLDLYPESEGIFLDFSDAMTAAAREKLGPDLNRRARVIQADYGLQGWRDALPDGPPYDGVVSGFSIHHQTDARKQELYREIFDLLAPGGFFLNLEHVLSGSATLNRVFDEHFIDALYAYHRAIDPSKSREAVAQEFYHRPDKGNNILAPLNDQCDWLREIGFQEVDCFFKALELSLFGGVKPG